MWLRDVAGAGEDGEARVFGKGRIGLGELAKEKLGAFGGFDQARVQARSAKAEASVGFRRRVGGGHGEAAE